MLRGLLPTTGNAFHGFKCDLAITRCPLPQNKLRNEPVNHSRNMRTARALRVPDHPAADISYLSIGGILLTIAGLEFTYGYTTP